MFEYFYSPMFSAE